MLQEPKVYGIDFRNDNGLIYCYINGKRQMFATSENSPISHLPITYMIENDRISFIYHQNSFTIDIIE